MTSPTRKSRFTLSFRNFVELCNRLKGIGEDISIHAKAYSKCRYTRKAMAL